MIELLYVSMATRAMSPADLDEIRQSSVTSNTKVGVTGALMYGNRAFMQILEGEEAAVRSTLARIARDPRHRSVDIVYEGKILARSFPEWMMAVGEGHVPWRQAPPSETQNASAADRNVAVDLFKIMAEDLTPHS